MFMLITVVAVKEDIPMSDNGKPDALRANFGKVGDMNYEEDQGCCSKGCQFCFGCYSTFQEQRFSMGLHHALVNSNGNILCSGIYPILRQRCYLPKRNRKSNMTVTTMTSLLLCMHSNWRWKLWIRLWHFVR